MLRPSAPLTKDQLTATLRECRSALADDMLAIGDGISCSQYGDIDLLALDNTHRLTIIDLEITGCDGLLVRGISHVDWIVRHLSIVERLYPDWAIDGSRQPQVFLVAPRFSAALLSGIRRITQPAICCFRYHAVELSGGAGIFVERLDGEEE